jgi:hypothetical protein
MLINACTMTSGTNCPWVREVLPIKLSKNDTEGTKRQILDANDAFRKACIYEPRKPCTHFGVEISQAACGG